MFEWNSTKASSNVKKHGVSFEEAQTAFADEFGRLIPDPDHSVYEERFILLGLSDHLRLLVVCHCELYDGKVRLISARKANAHERKSYEEHTHA